jgi:hypothetical protein
MASLETYLIFFLIIVLIISSYEYETTPVMLKYLHIDHYFSCRLMDSKSFKQENQEESFVESLPADVEGRKISLDPIDYETTLKDMALEGEVKSSHGEYVKKRNKVTSTASKLSVRSDPNDINPWVGLRRPRYRTKDNKELLLQGYRTGPSEDINQLSKYETSIIGY